MYWINTDLVLSTQPMRTNSVLTPCKQGAVLSRYSLDLGNDVPVEIRLKLLGARAQSPPRNITHREGSLLQIAAN